MGDVKTNETIRGLLSRAVASARVESTLYRAAIEVAAHSLRRPLGHAEAEAIRRMLLNTLIATDRVRDDEHG